MIIREATPADALGIARVRVAGWRAAYRGLLEDCVLEALDAAADAQRYAASWDGGMRRRVVVLDDRVVGFATLRRHQVGPDESPSWPAGPEDGEISGLYLAPEYWSQGIGRALMADALDCLAQAGYSAVRLWVLRDNVRARRFYAAAGFQDEEPASVVKAFTSRGGTRPAPEVRYVRGLP